MTILEITGLIVSTGILGGMFYLGSRFGTFETKLSNLIYRLQNLPCMQNDGHCALVHELDGKIDNVNIKLSFIEGELGMLKENFNLYIKGKPQIMLSYSPTALTTDGLEIAKQLNAKDIIEKNWERIYENLEKNISDKNPYDIQEYCLYVAATKIDAFLSDEDINFLKQFAYNEGNTIFYYHPIFALIIRDKYLALKGIDVLEVDIHDPKKQ